MVVPLLLLIRDIDADQVHVLHISHLRHLLLIRVLRFALTMVEGRIDLFPSVLHFLASPIVSALGLFHIAIGHVPLSFQLRRIVGMAFTYLFVACGKVLQGICDLKEQFRRVSIMFGSSRLESG